MTEDDPVARNRATPPRKSYDRDAVGASFTRRWGLLMTTVLGGATVLLIVLLVRG